MVSFKCPVHCSGKMQGNVNEKTRKRENMWTNVCQFLKKVKIIENTLGPAAKSQVSHNTRKCLTWKSGSSGVKVCPLLIH